MPEERIAECIERIIMNSGHAKIELLTSFVLAVKEDNGEEWFSYFVSDYER